MNEEMYEEEDDDLPNQYRRISALNPALGHMYNLNDRFNSYVAGQIGVRNYLHQAIFSANQHRYQNQMFGNAMLQQAALNSGTMSPQAMNGFNPESPWPMANNAQAMQPPTHSRSASIATPQDAANAQQRTPSGRSDSASPAAMDDRRMSMPTQSSRPSIKSSPKQAPTPPSTEASMYPLTTKLPIETQQIIDGQSRYMNQVSPSQLTAGIPLPSHAQYSYNPNKRSQKSADANPAQSYTGLDQTLSPFAFNSQMTTPPMSEPQSAMSAPASLEDFGGFGQNFTGYDNLEDFNLFGDNDAAQHNHGQITPTTPFDLTWDGGDFFSYNDATG